MNIVTDFEIFTKNGYLKSNLSEDLMQEYIKAENIIKSGLHKTSGLWHNSGLCCREVHIEKNCEGNIHIKKTDIPHKIIWQCSLCRLSGEILNWRKSPAYREYIKINKNSHTQPAPNLILSGNIYNELKSLCSSKPDFSIIINNAVEKNNYFYMNISEFDILLMLGYISEQINSTSADKEKFSNLHHTLINSYTAQKTAFF